MGKKATLINHGGEAAHGQPWWRRRATRKIIQKIDKLRASKEHSSSGRNQAPAHGYGDLTLEHTANWFECMRSRQQPHCTVDEGFSHSVACIMCTDAYWWGRSNTWNAGAEVISGPPAEN